MEFEEARDIVKISLRDDLIDEKSFFSRVVREKCIEALEKQIPKQPIQKMMRVRWSYCRSNFKLWVCPVCNKAVEVEDNEGYQSEYYPTCECGQRIDWADILEEHDHKWDDYEEVK